MKRSLFIAIAVLIVMALFVGCKAEIADRDELVEVSVAGELSRALDLTAESNNLPVTDLFWYYTAEKKDSSFTTGETRDEVTGLLVETAVKDGAGLATLKLGATGQFSKGAWEFKFYGYDKVNTDTTAKLIYSAETTVTLKKSLSLSLTLKAESVPASTLYLKGVTYTSDLLESVYDSVKLFIEVNDEPFGSTTGYEGTKNGKKATFAAQEVRLDENGVPAGTYQVAFEVRGYIEGEDGFDIIGQYESTVQIVAGMKYTISDSVATPGITPVDVTGGIGVGGGEAPASDIKVDTQTLSNTADIVFETANNPKGTAGKTTTVTFPEGSFTSTQNNIDAELTVTAYNAAAAQGQFQIQGSDNKPIAGLDLSLSGITSFGEYATVTTYIGTGLNNPTVVYDGNLEQPKNISYDASTGYISFDTKHFSSFYVLEAEAKIGDTVYATLKDAFAAVPDNTATTIVVLKDAVIVGNAGITIAANKSIVFDLNGFTVTNAVNEDKASQVFKVVGSLTIKDSSDVLENGTGAGVLKNGIKEGTHAGEWWSTPQYNYATNVITNCGNLTIESGKIEQTCANSICYAVDNQSTSYNVTLNVDGGLITGLGTLVRLYCNSTTKNNILNMTDGTITTDGYSAVWVHLPGSKGEEKRATLNISGGTISGASYAFYDYSYGDIFTNVSYTITGGTFDGAIYSYGAENFTISGGVFNDPVISKAGIAISGGSFSDSSVFDYLVDGASIKLLNNVTLEGPIELTNGTLDLNGYTIDTEYYLDFYGTSTIKNGTVNYLAENDGKCAIWANADGKLTVESVEVNSKTADDKTAYAVSMWGSGAELVINSGVFNGYVGTNGQMRNEVVTINGGTFAHGCYFPAHGTYTINDGTFNDLVEIKSGTLTINGGSFNCGSAGEAQYIAYENGNAIHNAALGAVAYNGDIAPSNDYGPTPIVNINGGTFNGAICVARKTADIAYPTITIASGLNLSVVELGVVPANN